MGSNTPSLPIPAPSARLLTEHQAAALLGLSTSYLRKLRGGVCKPPVGFPVARKIGRAVRYSCVDVENFIAGPTVAAQ